MFSNPCKRLLSLSVILAVCASFLAPTHPIHIMTTDIVHSEQFNNIEVTHKIFTDDLEKLLTRNYKGLYNVGLPNEHPDTDANIKHYFAQNFDLKINAASARCDFMGKEVGQDAVYLYFEVENVDKVQNLTVKNTLLFDIFSDQSNLNHVRIGSSKKSVRCNKQKSEHLLSF